MKIGLVFNPFGYKLHEENIRVVQKYFGLFPPLSLAWVAAIAERAGHEAIIVDARTLRLSKDETLEILRGFKPDALGFMMTTYMFRETLEWARFLKERLRVPALAGGYNMRVYPRESLENDVIDYGCYQQALKTVPELLRMLESGGPPEEVPGLIYRRGGETVVNEPHPDEQDFDSYPNPARHLLPNHLYAEFPTERKNFTVMVTSLGCPMGCTFCEASRTSYSPRSAETVLNEMEECRTRHNIREIDIFDYEFAIQRKRTEAICDGIVERGLDVTWACRTRIDSVDGPLMEKMSRAGCRRIYFGIECGRQEILDEFNKGITVKRIRDTVGAAREIGIKTLGFFLVGVPGETRQSLKQTVRFAVSLNLDYAQFSKLTAKPLTPMWREMTERTGGDYWREYILGNTPERSLPREWMKISNAELDSLTKWAYVRFYARPAFLLRATLAVASFTEFKRKLFALFDMLFSQERKSEDWFGKGREFVAYNENPSAARAGWRRMLKSGSFARGRADKQTPPA